MAIVQISKIQIRTGAEADLPQLDVGELGFATDTKTAYIGNDPLLDPPVGIEPTLTQLLTDSPNCHINASQLTGVISVQVANLKIGGGRNGFVLKTDGTGNLSWGGSGGGVSGGGDISNSLDTQLLFNSEDEIYGDSNLVYNKTTQILNLTGTLTATNIAGNITTSTQTNITRVGTLVNLEVTGNIISGNANLGNLVTSNYFSGNGSLLTGVLLSNTANTVISNAQPNITSVGTLTSLFVSGVSTLGLAGNVKIGGGNPGQILTTDGAGNLSWATVSGGNGGGSTYGNANVASYLNSGFFNTTFIGSIPNATRANSADSANAVAGANVSGQVSNSLVAGTIYTNAQPNITSIGTLVDLNVTGDITAGNITLGNLVTANYFAGNGRQLSSIAGANVTGVVANATYATTAGSAGNANIVPWSGVSGTPNTLSGYGITQIPWSSISNTPNTIADYGITNTYGPILYAHNSVNQTIARIEAGTITDLVYSTKSPNMSTDSFYNTTTGVYTPLRSGWYQVNATISLELTADVEDADGTFFIQIIKNTLTVEANGTKVVKAPSWGSNGYSVASKLIYLNGVTDSIRCKLYSANSTGSWRTLISITNYFQAVWIRP